MRNTHAVLFQISCQPCLIADVENFVFAFSGVLPEPISGLDLPASIRLGHTEE